jgi:hypothetical protein
MHESSIPSNVVLHRWIFKHKTKAKSPKYYDLYVNLLFLSSTRLMISGTVVVRLVQYEAFIRDMPLWRSSDSSLLSC